MKVVTGGGNEREFIRMRQIRRATQKGIRVAWFALGRDLKEEANREILRKPKGGRTYLIRTRTGRRRHVASAPGETHANRKGRLRRSLSWKVHGSDSMDFGYGVSTTARNEAPGYGRWVEFGHRQVGGGRVAPRPSLDNAINATQREAEQNFERAIRTEVLK